MPARYGGFETAVEQIATRFVEAGVESVVYCRNAEERLDTYRGVELVHLPAVKRKSVETLSHTALSVLHLLRHRADVVLLFNGANAPFVPVLQARGMPTAVHVDGIEWQRAKWSGPAKRWHRFGERAAVRFADAIVADAPGIARYYRTTHDADTVQLAYGAPIVRDSASDRLGQWGLEPNGYHLVVARFEPENHVDRIIDGYLRTAVSRPLIVVGDAAFDGSHGATIRALATRDARVRLLGSIWDQVALDQLYAHAFTYVHGHSVGGTNPSLLRAMGAGAPVIAFDVEFNRDIVGESGRYFDDADSLCDAITAAEADTDATAAGGAAGRRHVEDHYRWADVAAGYLDMCQALVEGADPVTRR